MPNGKDHDGRTKYKRKVIHELFEHDKTYFENVTDILPSGEHVLEDGENEFNFEVFIPLDCLGSFHHSTGVRIGKGRLRPCGKIRNRPFDILNFTIIQAPIIGQLGSNVWPNSTLTCPGEWTKRKKWSFSFSRQPT